MSHVLAIPAHLEWASCAMMLLVGVLPDRPLATFFVRRGFGRGLGPFRMFRLARILFVLLFTTILGPIVLVTLLVFAGYWFFANRRR
jgi:hypothetical protein